MNNFQMSDYVDVAARLIEFREKHPEGSLQPADLATPFTVQTIGDQTFIVVVAAAYRTSDDPRPGIGMAYEQFPGRTPYTRGSELQNAETSAWGRAIVATLAADTKKGVASADEVRNRSAEREQAAPAPARAAQAPAAQAPTAGAPAARSSAAPPSAADKVRTQIGNYIKATQLDGNAAKAHFVSKFGKDTAQGSEAELLTFLADLKKNGLPTSVSPVRAAA